MNNKRNLKIAVHIFGSILFLMLPIVFSPDVFGWNLFRIPPFQRDLGLFVLLLATFYIHFYWLTPRFLLNKKKVHYVLFTLINLAIIYFLLRLIFPLHLGPHDMDPHFHPEFPKRMLNPIHLPEFPKTLFNFLVVILAALIIQLYHRTKRIEKQKTELELKMLRDQIQPHFIFNTLNGVYSLAVTENATKSAKAILQLSDILRFNLQIAGDEKISLRNELKYIESYVDLQRTRAAKNVVINLSVDTNNQDVLILPFMLISLVENAFKYGINPDVESRIELKIRLTETNKLEATFFNLKVPLINQEQFGTGLQTLQRRLEHYYSNKHSLRMVEDEKSFSVNLIVEL